MFNKVFQLLGMNSSGIAQQLSAYGNPADIQNAIDRGDVKNLSFIEKEAQRIQQQNPALFNQVRQMFFGH